MAVVLKAWYEFNYCPCDECEELLKKVPALQEVNDITQHPKESHRRIFSITGDLSKVEKLFRKHGKRLKKFTPTNDLEMKIISPQSAPVLGIDDDERMALVPRERLVEKTIGKKTQEVCYCPKCNYKLELDERYDKLFKCHGCKEDGFRSIYRCGQCGCDLHTVCTSPKRTISPEIFPGSTFVFCHQGQPSSTRPRSCDACGKDIHGHFYHCEAKNLNLHPCCSNLKAKLQIDGTAFVLGDKVSSSSLECKWCNNKKPLGNKMRNPGCSYVSTVSSSKYIFHVYCITKMVHETWKKGDINCETDDFVLALEKMDLKYADNSNKKGGRSGGSGFWSTVGIFVSTIAACLLGNPIVVLVPFFLGQFFKAVPKLLPKQDK